MNNLGYGINGNCNIKEHSLLTDVWQSWYKGIGDFHKYSIWNGKKKISLTKKQLRMGKKMCEDRAGLTFNEMVKITVDDKTAQSYIDKTLKSNRFRTESKKTFEKACALGTGALAEFVIKGKPIIEYYTVHSIIPLRVINGQITDCVLYSSEQKNDSIIYHVSAFILIDDAASTPEIAEARIELGIDPEHVGYIVDNRDLTFDKKGKKLSEVYNENVSDVVMIPDGLIPFQIFKPTIANNMYEDVSYEPGYGISIFANSISSLEAVDNAFDNMDNEVSLSKKRIVVNDKMTMARKATNGALEVLFDPNDLVYQSMDLGSDSETFIKEINMEMRIDQCEKALNTQLNILGFMCGFGNGYYKFEGGQLKTATEVISDKNPLFRTVKGDQLNVEQVLIEMTKNLLFIGGFDEKQGITINFDDSIFEDTESVRRSALLEVNSNIIDHVEYFMRVYKLSEEQAIEKVKRINIRKLTLQEQTMEVVDDE